MCIRVDPVLLGMGLSYMYPETPVMSSERDVMMYEGVRLKSIVVTEDGIYLGENMVFII